MSVDRRREESRPQPKPHPPACTNVAHLDGLATGTIVRTTEKFVYRYRVCRTCHKVQGIARIAR